MCEGERTRAGKSRKHLSPGNAPAAKRRFRFTALAAAVLMAFFLSACGSVPSDAAGAVKDTVKDTVDGLFDKARGDDGEAPAETPPVSAQGSEGQEDAATVSIPPHGPAEAEEMPAPETEEIPPEIPDPPSDPAALVRVSDYIPDIEVDLKYATADNFTGTVIYDFTDAYLRYGTVEKLAAVQDELEEMGLGLRIWDALRPVSAQFKLWEVCPNAAYVANPNTGYSFHSRGNTVDITLIALDGGEVPMPTGFDDFSALADRDYSDCGEQAASNARLLEDVMAAHGFQPYQAEWWHFSDEVSYGVEEGFVIPATPME